jgi:hypothetical protein
VHKSPVRKKLIIPNRSSFEAGSAELNFARDKQLPHENEVNALFNNMLASFHFRMKLRIRETHVADFCRSAEAFMTQASNKVWNNGE